MNFNEIIAKNLKKEMERKGMSIYKLHIISNVPCSTIKRVLNCQIKELRIGYLLKIADALKISMDALVERQKKKP